MATALYTIPITAASLVAPVTYIGTAANGGLISKLDEWESLTIVAFLKGLTGGTLDVYLQSSIDEGTNFSDYAHFAQQAAGGGTNNYYAAVNKYQQVTNFPTLGYGTVASAGALSLAVNTIIGGPFGQQMRVVAVAGAGTSLGFAQTISLYGQRGISFR